MANIVAAFARMSREDSQKLLAPEYYPSWVLTWLNSHLTKIWPHVNEAASELIKANVEPVLEQYTPIVLSVIEDKSDGITLELEMNWDGNPDIVLDVKTRLGVGLPVQ
ncbi:hypothetical protein Tco_1188196, partial [Tanacetum coccineum]